MEDSTWNMLIEKAVTVLQNWKKTNKINDNTEQERKGRKVRKGRKEQQDVAQEEKD